MVQHAALSLMPAPMPAPMPALSGRRNGHAALNRGAALASVAVAALLVCLKAWAAWSTGSTAMLGSLADTALDLIASLATLAGVWIAAQPEDSGHRFGHGKAEAMAAMFQVTLISLSALWLAGHAVRQLAAGTRTQAAESGIGVSLIAMAMTLALLAWQRHVLRRTGNLAVATDHLHYQSDLLLNLAVIAALALDRFGGFAMADPLFALAIAAWLAWGAWKASQRATAQLMDAEWPDEKRRRFLTLMADHPQVRGVHDLRTRTSGNRDFAQFHVWVDPGMTVRDAHRVMDEIEQRLKAGFPDVETIIHTDPDGHRDTGMAERDLLAKP